MVGISNMNFKSLSKRWGGAHVSLHVMVCDMYHQVLIGCSSTLWWL